MTSREPHREGEQGSSRSRRPLFLADSKRDAACLEVGVDDLADLMFRRAAKVIAGMSRIWKRARGDRMVVGWGRCGRTMTQTQVLRAGVP